jgi:hypothetical protein
LGNYALNGSLHAVVFRLFTDYFAALQLSLLLEGIDVDWKSLGQ